MTVSSSSLVESAAAGEVIEEFLAGYWSARTRANYAFILNGWLTWCATHDHDPTSDVDPRLLEAWIRQLQARGYAANTIAGRVSAVSAFYRWCVRQQRCRRNPVEVIRRPRRPTESTAASLTRHELTDWLAAAERRVDAWWAAAMLLALNGLRCGELIACDVTDVGSHSCTTRWRYARPRATSPPWSRWRHRPMQAVATAIDGRAAGRCC